MSLMGFNEKGTRDQVLQNIINNSNYIMMFGIGAAMLFLSLRYIFPNDLFTSALFFDGLGLQQVFSSPAAIFSEGGFWEDLPDLTTEAFAFAASLALTQVYLGYKAATARGSLGDTLKGYLSKNTGKIETEYVGWFLAYVFIALFDTWTDTEYRSFYGSQGMYLKALLVSFFFYNLFSEWAIVQGSKLVLNYGFVLKHSLFKGTKLDSGGVPQQKNGGGQKQGGGKQQGGNPQGGKPNHGQPGRQNHGNGGGQQRQQNPAPATMRPYRGEPSNPQMPPEYRMQPIDIDLDDLR
jgi:hypothetical protein